jgi:hypothetical protein
MYWVCVSFCNIWKCSRDWNANSMLKCRDLKCKFYDMKFNYKTTEFSF